MKAKLIQIVLGAIGSAIAVIMQQITLGAMDPVTTVAAGSATTVMLGDTVVRLVS